MKLTSIFGGLSLGLAALSLSGHAFAHGFSDCTTEAKETWKPQADAEAAATAAGYTVSKSKIAGSCYEIYAKDKDGKKFELFYNPATLELVKTQDDD